MARFTIAKDRLYTVGDWFLKTFDITNANSPQEGNTVELDWGIETIFPYQDNLFIGAVDGMHILDNSNPDNPIHLSTFAHVRSCDPVVVEGSYAYVTLRSGNTCAGFVNQLDVIDVTDLSNPTLVKTYEMQNPHGLGIDNGTLFLCEGEFGLKVFSANDPLQISNNQLAHFQDMHSFDVIPLGNVLLMIGNNGLYQYDYSNPESLQLLSVIPVIKE